MTKTVYARVVAVSDSGNTVTLRLEEPLDFAPEERVLVACDEPDAEVDQPNSFLETALGMDLKGPPDWSERIGHPFYERPDEPGE